MYFNKYPHPANFTFVQSYRSGRRSVVDDTWVQLRLSRYAGDIYRIEAQGPHWKKSYSQAGLTPPPKHLRAQDGGTRLTIDAGFGLRLTDHRDRLLLSSPSGMSFGVCGGASLFLLHHQRGCQYYGMGEKLFGLELSGIQTKFWNADVFADFHFAPVNDATADPVYVSIPYVIIKQRNTYIGLLLDNPHATFISTGAPVNIAGQMDLGPEANRVLTIGAEQGKPDLYILVGPSLRELTRKLQKLVGVTPLPPAWALGYHQCRWGYRSAADLRRLDRAFTRHGIPCDGLWLDIEYMQNYKVFTFDRKHFTNLRQSLRELRRHRRQVVPILDPGVKKEAGYSVYDDGCRKRVFCRNPQGRNFVGLVWPGETVFPDFSLPRTRTWWAERVRRFLGRGFEGVWIDMNDPSTGSVACLDMLFDEGRAPHHTFHNQYALGMARATREGFTSARPNRRPFLLSRSGCTGIGRYSALWTGDNVSNYAYLKKSIGGSLNLALSGVPFNGPDIGGFAGDATAQLLSDWMKACFLFPFCRNHTMTGTRPQEPWALGTRTLNLLRHYIRLRYKFRPYLYNLFIRQEEEGEAILRPLFYDFQDTTRLPLGAIDDQFMVGPYVMQAPLVSESKRTRTVALPGNRPWYSAQDGKWISGGRRVRVRPGKSHTPLYVCEGAMLPLACGDPETNAFDGSTVEAHLFLRRRSNTTCDSVYAFDDGSTLDYTRGKRSETRIRARVRRDAIHITTDDVRDGLGKATIQFVLYDAFREVWVNGARAKCSPFTWRLAGSRQRVWRVRT